MAICLDIVELAAIPTHVILEVSSIIGTPTFFQVHSSMWFSMFGLLLLWCSSNLPVPQMELGNTIWVRIGHLAFGNYALCIDMVFLYQYHGLEVGEWWWWVSHDDDGSKQTDLVLAMNSLFICFHMYFGVHTSHLAEHMVLHTWCQKIPHITCPCFQLW